MKSVCLTIILCALLCATPAAAQRKSHGYNTSFTLSKRNFCDTIPLHVEDGQLYVDAQMNGKTVRFNIDTGSSQGVVYADTPIRSWRELGSVVSHDAAGNSDTVRVVELPTFSLNGLRISHYVATVYPQRLVKPKYDAIIGFDLINKGLYTKIDLRRQQLILSDREELFEEEQGYALRYRLKWFVPYVHVSPFKRHVDEVLFDTGSRPLYRMNKQSFEEHAYKSKQVNRQVEDRVKGNLSIGTHGAEATDEVVFLNLDRFKWAEFTFLKLRVNTTQGPSTVGADLLKYGSVFIDPFRRRILFQPYDQKDSVTVDNKLAGIWFVPVNNRPAVGLVWEKSEAYKSGMRQGDIILRIDGRPIETFRAYTEFPFVQGHVYRFTLYSKEGRIKEALLKRP